MATMLLKIEAGWVGVPKSQLAFDKHIDAAEHEWENGLNAHRRTITKARGGAKNFNGVGVSHLSEVRNDCQGLRNRLEALRLCIANSQAPNIKQKELLKAAERIKGRCNDIEKPSYDEINAASQKH